jgi:hypothetical protein
MKNNTTTVKKSGTEDISSTSATMEGLREIKLSNE